MSNHAQQKVKTVEEISHFWTTTNARHQLEYRLPMRVTELMVFPSAFGWTSYYVCPRCHITMEREFQSYCDRCGQRLDWKRYRHAKVIWPGGNTRPVQDDVVKELCNQLPTDESRNE